jgi:hypothetical protein
MNTNLKTVKGFVEPSFIDVKADDKSSFNVWVIF